MKFKISIIILALIGSLIFLPGVNGGFILDDGINILKNRLLYIDKFDLESFIYAALSFHDDNGSRSLPMLSFAIDYWRAGSMDPIIFKITNIIIHGISIIALCVFLKKLFDLAGYTEKQTFYFTLSIALIWAIHPLQLSSVLYIVQRMQTMANLFIFLSLWSYLGMRQRQIQGRNKNIYVIALIIFWLLALLCKEDAILLPLYCFILEVCILKFRSSLIKEERDLKSIYIIFLISAVSIYLFYIIPYYWCWDNCGSRNFNTVERLLTQARVLVMYIGQIVFPVPDSFPFIYDSYIVSKGLFQPWTTFSSIIFLISLFLSAIFLISKRPLFSFGIFLFFSGHFLSSNVILLELVFEHRNQLPSVGIIIASADILYFIFYKYKLMNKLIIAFIVLILSITTTTQAHIWGNAEHFGERLVRLSPYSLRAWNQYATVYFIRYNLTKDESNLFSAINITNKAMNYIQSPSLSSNILIYKSLTGSVLDEDWIKFIRDLENSKQPDKSRAAVFLLFDNALKGYSIDKGYLLEAFKVLSEQSLFSKKEYIKIGLFFYSHNYKKDALYFFEKSISSTKKREKNFQDLFKALHDNGYDELAEEVKNIIIKD